MKMNIDKARLTEIGKTGLKIGKHILIEGTIAVTAKGVAQGLRVGMTDGFEGVKRMEVDDLLGVTKKERKLIKEEVMVTEFSE